MSKSWIGAVTFPQQGKGRRRPTLNAFYRLRSLGESVGPTFENCHASPRRTRTAKHMTNSEA